jgi:hypothetical protein
MSIPSNFIKKVDKASYRQLEIVIWLILATVVYIYPISHLLSKTVAITPYTLLLYHYPYVFVSIFFIVFPILFRLIFGFFPFEFIRIKQKIKTGIIVENKGDAPVTITYEVPEETPKDYKQVCINESKAIAERVFARSGVYLLAGTLTAFAGIMVFYSPLFDQSKATTEDITQRLLDFLPRFGALFFIEFIAIFFLRQFRIMHEEYRYYEAIKRKRQDNFNLLELIEKFKDKPELIKSVIELYSENSSLGKLAKDETTQILETQKILNQQTDILGKMFDWIKDLRRK